MPGPWTPEQRARYAATIAARREAEAAGMAYVAPTADRPRKQHRSNGHHPVAEVLALPVYVAEEPPIPLEHVMARLDSLDEAVAAIRGMVVDLSTLLHNVRAAQRELVLPDHEKIIRDALGAAEIAGRLERLTDGVSDTRKAVARLESKPCRIVEYRLDSRRVKDGGRTAQDQRRAARRGGALAPA